MGRLRPARPSLRSRPSKRKVFNVPRFARDRDFKVCLPDSNIFLFRARVITEIKSPAVGGMSTARCGPLIPRSSGFNGGTVFDCPRFARAFDNVSTPCSVFESTHSYLLYSLRSEFCCWEYALRRSLLIVIERLFVPRLLQLYLV